MRVAKGLLAAGSAGLLMGGVFGEGTGLAAGGVMLLAGLLRLGGASWGRVAGFAGSLLVGLLVLLHGWHPGAGGGATALGVLLLTVWLLPGLLVSLGWAVRRRNGK